MPVSQSQQRMDIIRRMEVHKYWRKKHDEKLIKAIEDALALGMTQIRVAKFAGVSKATVHRIARNQFRPGDAPFRGRCFKGERPGAA